MRNALLILALLSSVPAHAGWPAWCSLLYRGWNGYSNRSTQDFLNEMSPPESRAAVVFRETYNSAPPENRLEKRVALLKRLGLIAADAVVEPPRIRSREDSVRHHAGGGTYTRERDQYGDVYGNGIDGPDTHEELSRYFNLPQRDPKTSEFARFLRDAQRDFPRDGLTPDDLHVLEPLPQHDPLLSYLGTGIVRMWTADKDKPMPPYVKKVVASYPENGNYFRRPDGVYYIYDFPAGSIGTSDFTSRGMAMTEKAAAETHLRRLLDAIDTAPDPEARRKAIQYYVDSVTLFPEIGKERLLKVKRAYELALKEYGKELDQHGTDKEKVLFRVLSTLSGVKGPKMRDWWGSEGAEGYLAYPQYLRVLHREMGVDKTHPDLYRAFEAKAKQVVADLQSFPDQLDGAPKNFQQNILRLVRDIDKRGPTPTE